ncbi:KdsC family phosphatase [Aquimarina agarivorans]|uniref:KdsC family phosphatase n=1 Tax=Aquimarina agarivorans TaxID=980584 RepID=UPI000248E863|nr:HAD-IIIA family hydrolase [Aquimarina agarivorans]
MSKSYKEYLNEITTFMFDVDGVYTDGSLLIDHNGNLLRSMNTKDGYATKVALDKGYNVCIISGGKNEAVKSRFEGLGVKSVYLGAGDKIKCYDEYLKANNVKPEQVLYMGDDLPDLPVMNRIGLPTCPQDAVAEVKAASKYISHINGGKGCVRDVIEQVLKVQGKWPTDDERTITSA